MNELRMINLLIKMMNSKKKKNSNEEKSDVVISIKSKEAYYKWY